MDEIAAMGAALCAGISVFALVIFLYNLFKTIEIERNTFGEDVRPIPLPIRMFLPFATNFNRIFGSSIMKEHVVRTAEKLRMAGFDQTLTAEQFIAARILLFFVGMLFTLVCFFCDEPIYGLLLLLCAGLYPGTWLNKTIARRHLEILKSLPNVLDLLTLSVEAGKDFLSAMRDIVSRRKNDELGYELRKTLHEIQLGKPRQQALREMGRRVQQTELVSVLNAIIQSDELGVSIGQVLRIQSEQLRAKRFAHAEKLANEAPVKILFPIAIFIFPAVFIILIAPIVLKALNTL